MIELTSGDADHEQVVFLQDRAVKLRAIVAVHSTRLGPALGGTRFHAFASESEALEDVLRLSRAMSYKNAAAGLDLGGGKAVIIGDPRKDKNEDLLTSYARYVDSLGGRYITTEDVGTTVPDMDHIARHCRYVTGTSQGSGDPSEATAWGVYSAMRAIAERLWGTDSLEGLRVAIQGVGKVGSYIAGHLASAGCRLTVTDTSADAAARIAQEHGATVVGTEEIYDVTCDIFSPCALGGSLNAGTIPRLDCAAVCGCANNQLLRDEDAGRMASRGIVYAPDFIVNAGGVINISYELREGGYDRDLAFAHTARIGQTLKRVIDRAAAEGTTTAAAADGLAEERLYG